MGENIRQGFVKRITEQIDNAMIGVDADEQE